MYRSPLVARQVRGLLNRTVGQGLTVAQVSAGPLKCARFELDLQKEKYYWLGTHEPQVQDWIAAHVKPGMVVYDVGSHLGYFSLILARLVGEQGRVTAFEPDPSNFARLSRTVELNQARNIEAVNQAVTEQPGSVEMLAGRETMSLVVSGARGGSGQAAREAKMISVLAVSLDAWVLEQDHAPPDLIKIDVEGHEEQALMGARRVLETYQPLVLCEVHHAQAGQAVWSILTGLGYSLFHLETGRPVEAASDTVGGHVTAHPATQAGQAGR